MTEEFYHKNAIVPVEMPRGALVATVWVIDAAIPAIVECGDRSKLFYAQEIAKIMFGRLIETAGDDGEEHIAVVRKRFDRIMSAKIPPQA